MEHPVTIKRSSHVSSFKNLILLFQKIFEEPVAKLPDDKYLRRVLAKPEFLVFTAEVNGEVIGGLTAYLLDKYYYEGSEIFIYDLAVKKDYQRKGIGKRLIAAVQEYGRSVGVRDIFVAAAREDHQALDFYRATGGLEEEVVHFNYTLEIGVIDQ